MSMFTEGGQRRELCLGNVSRGGGICGICIHAGAIPARLGNIEEVLQLPALFTPSSCTVAVLTTVVLGTSTLPGSDAGCFCLAGNASMDAGGFPYLLLQGLVQRGKDKFFVRLPFSKTLQSPMKHQSRVARQEPCFTLTS